MASTANAPYAVATSRDFLEFPAAAAATIYRGSFVGLNPAGYAKPYVAGDLLVGVADAPCDNSLGGAGGKNVKVRNNVDLAVDLSGATFYHVGQFAYATDDNTVGLTGHPDGVIGEIVQRGDATGKAIVRMQQPGIPARNGISTSVMLIEDDFAKGYGPTGATAGPQYWGVSGQAHSALGLGMSTNRTAAVAYATGTFDAVAEVASAGLSTGSQFLVSKGITAEFEFRVSDIGDNAALDVDWGIGTLLTANSIANIDHADMVRLACFHLDGTSADILAQSDDNTTDVAAVDTTINNATGTSKKFLVIVRPTGSAEFWIDSGSGYARVLSSTTFAACTSADAATTLLSAFVNMEKTSDDTTAAFILNRWRIAGACA